MKGNRRRRRVVNVAPTTVRFVKEEKGSFCQMRLNFWAKIGLGTMKNESGACDLPPEGTGKRVLANSPKRDGIIRFSIGVRSEASMGIHGFSPN